MPALAERLPSYPGASEQDFMIGPKSIGVPSPKPETIRRIKNAAREEFAANGLDGARVDAIARRAGISKPLLFHYYGSKDDLYIEILNDASEFSLTILGRLELDDYEPEAALRRFVDTVFESYEKDHLLSSLILDQVLHNGLHIKARSKLNTIGPLLLKQFAALLKRGQLNGDFRHDLDVERLFVTTMLMPLGLRKAKATENYLSLEFDTQQASDSWKCFSADFLLRGIARQQAYPSAHSLPPAPVHR